MATVSDAGQAPSKSKNERLGDWMGGLAGAWAEDLEESLREATILVVDDLEINRKLLGAMLRRERYQVLEATRAQQALEIMEKSEVDLVVLDLMMPEMDGLECCRRIKINRRTQLVPVLMMSCMHGVEEEIAAIGAGADVFLGKPYHPEVLKIRIRSLLRQKSVVDRLEESEAIIFALAQAVEKRDTNTGEHCERLAMYSVALGLSLGLPRKDLVALHRGGYLHDIGKVAVPDNILFKPGPLTDEEWASMRAHTVRGEEICKPLKSLEPVLPIIRSHHERWDGSGYPDGLAGESIPMLARVLQLADIYDALTSERSYKRALSPREAIQLMLQETDKGWRDPRIMTRFLELHRETLAEPGGDVELYRELSKLRQSLTT